MRLIIFLLFVCVVATPAFAQCAQDDITWLDSFINWVYQVFGDKVLKIFGCLYGLSLVFKITGIIFSKFVLLTTWTDRDDLLFKRIVSHWSYRVLALMAELFLRLKLPKRKIR